VGITEYGTQKPLPFGIIRILPTDESLRNYGASDTHDLAESRRDRNQIDRSNEFHE
jgi:hypothetical protein